MRLVTLVCNTGIKFIEIKIMWHGNGGTSRVATRDAENGAKNIRAVLVFMVEITG